MRPSIDLPSLGGVLALVGMLVLASPGVRVRAEEPSAQASPSHVSGAVCSAQTQVNVSTDTTHLIEYYRQQALAAPRDADEPRMLNNRGYNYGPPPSVDPSRIAFEAARAR